MAYDELEYVKTKFSAYAIPKSLLVYPDGKMDVLDIRELNDKVESYKITSMTNKALD